MGLFIGVDVGTTKIAALILDTSSGNIKVIRVVPNSSETTDTQHKARGWSEWDAEKAVELTYEAMVKATAHNTSQEIEGIGVTGQMHGTVLVSGDHRVLTPFIGWQDRRCDEKIHGENVSYINRMTELAGKDGFSREGCHPATGYMGSTLFWLKENRTIPSEPATACFLPDYVVMAMTGQPPVTDPTNASSSGIFDVISREWDYNLIRKLQLHCDLLPEVRNSSEVLGGLTAEAAKKTGLQQGTPVCVACGDNQASFLGSVASPRKDTLVNIGTGGQVSVWVPEYTSIKGVDTRCYFDENYLLVGAGTCGGRSYALLKRFFLRIGRAFFGAKGDEELYDEMTRLAAGVPPNSDDLRFEPLFTGTRLDPALRASLLGMSESNFTPGHLARALLEGVAGRFKGLYDEMLQSSVSPRIRLVGSGNGLRKNALLTKILSDTFNMPLLIPLNTEEAALGAAILSAIGCGEFRDTEDATQLIKYQHTSENRP
ncbi:MAG: FGGY family carbohydrate kinase [Candidatus Bathyarchaeota archaeon]|nr:FGGY family carbohydrate kinase [Candidatus Bathyarchaeota archaeon]